MPPADAPRRDGAAVDGARADAAVPDARPADTGFVTPDAVTVDRASLDGPRFDGGGDAGPALDVSALDVAFDDGATPGDPSAPRPRWPPSGSVVTARQPAFSWILAAETDGARVDVCRERTCAAVIATFDAAGSTGTPTSPLPSGTLFWRLRGLRAGVAGAVAGPSWPFIVASAGAGAGSANGAVFDANGDALAEIVTGAPAASMVPGAVHVFAGSRSGVATAPTTTLVGTDGVGTRFGDDVTGAGDVNGDGFGDLVIGAPGALSSAGRLHVFLGSAFGLEVTPLVSVGGDLGAGSGFATTVAAGGDIDADGYADVLVGAPLASGGDGSVEVHWGGPTGFRSPQTLRPPVSLGQWGAAVAGACDVDADGASDLVVGAPQQNAAYVLPGAASGVSVGGMRALLRDAGGPVGFGAAVACAVDLDGDGYADVLIGARGNGSGGAVYVFRGGAAGVSTTAARVWTVAEASGALFGTTVAGVGDVNGDGYADAVVGSPHGAAGQVHVFVGAATLPTTPFVSIPAPSGSSGTFGDTVRIGGDVNGDGYADVTVAASADTAIPGVGTYPGSGRVFVYLGGAGGVGTTPSVTMLRPLMEFGFFGASLARMDRRTAFPGGPG